MTQKEFMDQAQDADFIRRTWPELQSSKAINNCGHRTAKVVNLSMAGNLNPVHADRTAILRIRCGSIAVEFDTVDPVKDAVDLIAMMEDLP